MSSIRLIVSDLDGTLLSPDHKLAPEVASSIRAFVRKGGYFTIATGRPLLTARRVIEQLGIEIPVILCNGAVLAARGRILEQNGYEAGLTAELLVAAHEAGLNVLQFRDERIGVFGRTPEIETFEHKEQVACTLLSAADEGWRQGELDKVILLGDIRRSTQLWKRWGPLLGDRIAALQSESDYLELIPARIDKGTALRKVAYVLGVELTEVLAIGNQLNDLAMLKAAGVGIAVANSPDELKAAADYVTRSPYGEGVVEAIGRFGQ